MMRPLPLEEMGLPWWVGLAGLVAMIVAGLVAQLLTADRRDD